MANVTGTNPTKRKKVKRPAATPTPTPSPKKPTALDELRAHDAQRRKILRGK